MKNRTPIGTQAANRPRYFKSFASYYIPFRPVREVPFDQTQGLYSFYRAHYDATNRVARFEKIGLVRLQRQPRQVTLPERGTPGSAVYFAALGTPPDELTPGQVIAYDATEPLGLFFAGYVDESGETAQVMPFRKEIVFCDEYDYWPNGEMKTRTMRKGGESEPTVTEYNERGRELSNPKRPASAKTPAGGD